MKKEERVRSLRQEAKRKDIIRKQFFEANGIKVITPKDMTKEKIPFYLRPCYSKDLQEFGKEVAREVKKEMSEKLDTAISQCHGGGNGKRLLIQLREELK